MRYGLTRRVLGFQSFVEISADHYENARAAKVNLQTFLRIEENFDLLLANYADLERDLLDIALRTLVYQQPGWSSAMDNLSSTIRRLMNLLTVIRSYADHVPRHVGKAIGKAEGEKIRSWLREVYENVPEYRILWEIRNYAQHAGMPLHGIQYRSSREEAAGGTRFRECAVPWIEPGSLAEDSRFDSAVLEDLRRMGERVDLMPLVRTCVEAIAGVHQRLRDLAATWIGSWEGAIALVITQGKKVFGEIAELSLVKESDAGSIEEVSAIFPEQIERRRSLQEKNSKLANLSSRYVSGI